MKAEAIPYSTSGTKRATEMGPAHLGTAGGPETRRGDQEPENHRIPARIGQFLATCWPSGRSSAFSQHWRGSRCTPSHIQLEDLKRWMTTFCWDSSGHLSAFTAKLWILKSLHLHEEEAASRACTTGSWSPVVEGFCGLQGELQLRHLLGVNLQHVRVHCDLL